MQNAKDLREDVEINVFCYKSKNKLEDKIASEMEWLKKHLITRGNNKTEDYIRFIDLMKSYRIGEKNQNTIAVDLLADISKYYRRNHD